MLWGDLLAKVARGEDVSAADADNIRLIGNALAKMAKLSDNVDPTTGTVKHLVAGDIELSDAGASFGGGDIILDSSGISITFSDTYDSVDSIKFLFDGSGNPDGEIYAAEWDTNEHFTAVKSGFANSTDASLSASVYLAATALDDGLGLGLRYVSLSINSFKPGGSHTLNNESYLDLQVGTPGAWEGLFQIFDDEAVFNDTLKIKERAAATGDTAAYGQIWVKNTNPCELWFTDDAGADTKLA